MKLVITGVIVAFVLFYIMTSPDQAAHLVHTSWHGVTQLAHGMSGFVNKLSS